MFQIFKSLKSKLKYSGKERLSRWSILFLVTLDLFVYLVINYGLSFQTQVIINPNKEFPYRCQAFTESKNINASIFHYRFLQYDTISERELDYRCREILSLADSISQDEKLSGLKEKINKEKSRNIGFNRELSDLKSQYNTTLFEKIANQNREDSILENNVSASNIREKFKELEFNIKNSQENINRLKSDFYIDEEVVKLKKIILSNREEINLDYNKALKYYEIKKYLVELLFITPLAFIFFIFMKKWLQRENFVKYTLFKHLFFVSLIPLFTTIFSIIYIFIPQKFIALFIEFFYNLHIPFIVYYILIGIGIFIIYLIVRFIQNRANSRDKNGKIIFKEFYQKSLCVDCGNRVNYETMNFCPYCSNILKTECKRCGEMRIDNMSFCHKCGEES